MSKHPNRYNGSQVPILDSCSAHLDNRMKSGDADIYIYIIYWYMYIIYWGLVA